MSNSKPVLFRTSLNWVLFVALLVGGTALFFYFLIERGILL